MRKIALIGFMGSGKSCIGQVLASRLAVPFMDTDEEIERVSERSISEIFETEGEAAFRRLEEKILSDLGLRGGGFVLSCGGGIVMSPANRRLLASAYDTVWIDVPPAELLRRLAGETSHRPLLNSDDYERKAEELLRLRRPLYEEASRFVYRWKENESASDSACAIMEILGDIR
jgi:shikimate kinase